MNVKTGKMAPDNVAGGKGGVRSKDAEPLVEALWRAERAAAELSAALGQVGLLMLTNPDTETE
jgi:hypothetical protein